MEIFIFMDICMCLENVLEKYIKIFLVIIFREEECRRLVKWIFTINLYNFVMFYFFFRKYSLYYN